MAFSKGTIIDIYRRRARLYDLTANLYRLIGFREQVYRKMAIEELRLKPGGTVVEIGCGTGLNFPFIYEKVGAKGRIIGVDMTDSMLCKAKERVEKNGWKNVELVNTDAAKYVFEKGVNGVISTFAITLMPEYDTIIKNAANALAPEGRLVILDLKESQRAPRLLVKLGVLITKPFGVTLDISSRHPWESVDMYLKDTSFKEFYFGFAFLSSGEAKKG